MKTRERAQHTEVHVLHAEVFSVILSTTYLVSQVRLEVALEHCQMWAQNKDKPESTDSETEGKKPSDDFLCLFLAG